MLANWAFSTGRDAGGNGSRGEVGVAGAVVASADGMNEIFFGLKRAYHGVLRITRWPLACHGLTAARFDLMQVLTLHPNGWWQSKLRRKLGVSATTVSRMVRSLEQLGLLRRKRDQDEKRQLLLTLTRLGRRTIRIAYDSFVERKAAQLAVDSALAFRQDMTRPIEGAELSDPSGYPGQSLVEMESFDWCLRMARGAYGDTATLYYPWHPDD